MEEFVDFYLWVKHERKKKGISTRKLSEEITRSPSYISQLERGVISSVPYDVAYRIAKVLGHDESVLKRFNFTELENPETVDKAIEGNTYGSDVDRVLDKKFQETRHKFNHAIQDHVRAMSMEEMSGLLMLLNRYRDVMYELTIIPDEVKPDKVTHVMEMIKKYSKFMKEEYKK